MTTFNSWVFLAYSHCCKDIIQGLDLCFLSYCFELKSEEWHSFLNYRIHFSLHYSVCSLFAIKLTCFSKDPSLWWSFIT